MMKTVDVVADFGAKGDGVADDFAALQAALDSLKETGGTIHFPEGVYMLSDCLVFYSNQILELDKKAVLRRMKLGREEEPKELRYVIASYTEDTEEYGLYNGTHDVIIRGGVFDGNAELHENQKITLLNTCHCRNITVDGCSFVNCAEWHCIEFNSTEDSVIENCFFDGPSYTKWQRRTELIQFDVPKLNNYGPVFYPDGTEMEFVWGLTVCRNIKVRGNTFLCGDFAAIGNHDDWWHHDIEIYNNRFIGKPGYRGYVTFMSRSYNIFIHDNIIEDEQYKDLMTIPEEAQN